MKQTLRSFYLWVLWRAPNQFHSGLHFDLRCSDFSEEKIESVHGRWRRIVNYQFWINFGFRCWAVVFRINFVLPTNGHFQFITLMNYAFLQSLEHCNSFASDIILYSVTFREEMRLQSRLCMAVVYGTNHFGGLNGSNSTLSTCFDRT